MTDSQHSEPPAGSGPSSEPHRGESGGGNDVSLSRLASVEMQRLQAARAFYGLCAAIPGVLCLAWLSMGVTDGDFVVALFALIACFVLYARWRSNSYQPFVSAFKESVIGEIVKSVDPHLSYVKDGFMKQQVFVESGLFAGAPDFYYTGDDFVSGAIGRTAVAFSELNVKYLGQGVLSRAGAGTFSTPTPVFRGLFLAADHPGQFPGLTIVRPVSAGTRFWAARRRSSAAPPGAETPVSPGDPEFERHFTVFASDPAAARGLLSSGLGRRLIEYRARTGREAFVSFKGSRLCAALPFDRPLFEPRLFRSLLKPDALETYARGLGLAVGLVVDLDFDRQSITDSLPSGGQAPAPDGSGSSVVEPPPGGDLLPDRLPLPQPGNAPASSYAMMRGCGCAFLLLPLGLSGLFAVPAFFVSEQIAAQQYRTLAGSVAVTVAPDAVDPGHEGKLVHVTGVAATAEVLVDPGFDVAVTALRLRRKVEMLQWQEKVQGGAAPVYEKTWSEAPIPSGAFSEPGHENPATMNLSSVTKTAANVRLGAFALAPAVVEKIDDFTSLTPATNRLRQGPAGAEWIWMGDYFYREEPLSPPAVGTVRISFEVVEPAVVSVAARQAGGTLVDGMPAGRHGTLAVARAGIHSADSLLQVAEKKEKLRGTWKGRGWLIAALVVGFTLTLRPLAFFSDRLGHGTRILVGERPFPAALLLTGFVVSLAVGAAWTKDLPWVGAPALFASCLLLAAAVRFVRGRRRFEAGQPPATREGR